MWGLGCPVCLATNINDPRRDAINRVSMRLIGDPPSFGMGEDFLENRCLPWYDDQVEYELVL
jgi:hypothetical protein